MEKNADLTTIPGISDYPHYTAKQYESAVTRILCHNQSTIKFQSILSSATNAHFHGNYSMGRISHNYFSKCVFDGASLESVAGAGSIFQDVHFKNTNLTSSNFQNSSFEQCFFDTCQLGSCNIGESYFKDTTWLSCPLKSFNMGGSYFKCCEFIETRPGNLADSMLDGVYFENVRLTNMNLEFSTFKTIHSHNSIFPFSHMYLMDFVIYCTQMTAYEYHQKLTPNKAFLLMNM